ncbi:uncharacterized protein LOC121429192 [Lytechinus variegatus]|uniref:uncharacterized protein LOC121429192 n=1 Tax=Lytechinus variegatus TaxID=7654 RepID=UPI001BB113E3|nr:uncharacterized protein LOC121429192 [Lytechinus variegatus]
MAFVKRLTRCQRINRIILGILCILMLCSQNAFLDLFLIHHTEGTGFARGYIWVVVDALVVIFWLVGLVLPHLGLGPSSHLPQQTRGNIFREFLYAYMSWMVYAPLLIAKVVRLYNTVQRPSEKHWIFTPNMLQISISLTGITFVLLTYCHDNDVNNLKYKLRLPMIGKVVGFSILDGCDILGMLHVRGASDDYPPILRNVILIFGCAWFVLPLLPMISLRIMASGKQPPPKDPKPNKKQRSAEEKPSSSKQPDVRVKIQKSDIQRPEIKTAKSVDQLNHPHFERKVIQLRNDMFVSELSKSCKDKGQRCKSYDNLCSDTATVTPISQSKLSQSLNFSYWNYNQNCKVEPLTLDKQHRQGEDKKEKSNSFVHTKVENHVNHHNEDKIDHVVHEAMRHSKSLLFNTILFRNSTLVALMDVPYLAIRFHLWLVHGVSASVFITKNILMILGLVLEWCHDPPAVIKKSKAKKKAVDLGIMTGIGFP